MNNFKINLSRKISLLFVLLVSQLIPQTAFAHVHYELSVTSSFQANNDNQLESMTISWTYDDEISTLMLKEQKDVKKLGQKLINDLEKLSYFTSIKLNGNVIATKTVETYTLEEIKQDDYSNLKLTFTLPFKTPIKLEGKNTLIINHEDANLSAIIYYENPEAFVFDKNLNSNCKLDIVEKKDFEEGESPQDTKILCES